MNTIRLSEYGILPNTDITLSLYELFLQYPNDTEFLFEKGDYYFNPHKEMQADYRLSNTDVLPYRALGIWMKNMKNCVLNGNGARFWFEGQMQSVTMDHCENVKISNFTLNWKKPLVSEGIVVSRNEDNINVYIDPIKFPHRFGKGILEFDCGAGEWFAVWHRFIAFEPNSLTVRKHTADISFDQISEVGDNVYSFKLRNNCDVKVGDLLNLRHSPRSHANIFSEKCKNVTVEDVTVLSGSGLGCLAQFCKDLTYRRVHFLTDKASGRLVSGGHDDGMHLTCNSGTVTVTECTFHALMDDPINVHGCCVTCDEVVDEHTLRCRYRHPQACGFHYWAEEGNTVSFIERKSMQTIGKSTVKSYTLEDRETFLLSFTESLPEFIIDLANKEGCLALDNLTNTVDFVCTKNRFGSCRARGVLISTAGKILIKNNLFESSGSAILVAGDSNEWFESGECHDVEITENVFSDSCMGSIFQFCNGIISICPVVPEPDVDKPYHKNIRITKNTFDCSDVPVLYAFSCENLNLSDNRIFKSPASSVTKHDCGKIKLEYCKNALIERNEWIGNFNDSNITDSENCSGIVENI